MPFVEIETSAPLPAPREQQALIMRVSRATAEHLGKPERAIMVRLAPSAAMCFAASDEPCCFVAVRGIGEPAPEAASALNAALCQIIETALRVPTARTFVVLADVPRRLWGAGGRMLG